MQHEAWEKPLGKLNQKRARKAAKETGCPVEAVQAYILEQMPDWLVELLKENTTLREVTGRAFYHLESKRRGRRKLLRRVPEYNGWGKNEGPLLEEVSLMDEIPKFRSQIWTAVHTFPDFNPVQELESALTEGIISEYLSKKDEEDPDAKEIFPRDKDLVDTLLAQVAEEEKFNTDIWAEEAESAARKYIDGGVHPKMAARRAVADVERKMDRLIAAIFGAEEGEKFVIKDVRKKQRDPVEEILEILDRVPDMKTLAQVLVGDCQDVLKLS